MPEDASILTFPYIFTYTSICVYVSAKKCLPQLLALDTIIFAYQVISMKTFCKFVGEFDQEPKDLIVVTDKDVTLASYFISLGIVTPEGKKEKTTSASILFEAKGLVTPEAKAPTQATNPPEEGSDMRTGEAEGEGGEKGNSDKSDAAPLTAPTIVMKMEPPIMGSTDIGGRGSGRYVPNRKFTSQGHVPVVSKFSPNKFMGGVTKRSTHIKPYLEAYNRYTTAERRRLRGDPVPLLFFFPSVCAPAFAPAFALYCLVSPTFLAVVCAAVRARERENTMDRKEGGYRTW